MALSGDRYYASDGCLPKSRNRVLRGGSWINNGRNCRSAYRNNQDPDNRNDNNGFRLVLSPSSQKAASARKVILSVLRWQILMGAGC